MVNIIINDDGTDNNSLKSLLEQNDTLLKQNKELIKLNNMLNEKINNLEDEVSRISKGIDKLSDDLVDETHKNYQTIVNVLKNLEKKQEKPKETPIKEEEPKTLKTTTKTKPKKGKKSKKKGKKRGKAVKDTDVFVPNDSLCKNWNNLHLQKDGNIINKGKRKFVLPVDLNMLLYIQECDNPYMIRKDSKRLMEKLNINTTTWGKFIYNLRADNFKKIIDEYHNKLNRIKFSLNSEGMLLIDNKNTKIHKNLVYDWIQVMINTTNKQSKIISIQEDYPNFDKYIIRIILDSYNNSLLNNLVEKKKASTIVENNPSKRRNLIMNGGML